MNSALKIAVILTAIDNMTSVVNGAVNRSLSEFDRLKQGMITKFRDGAAFIAAGQKGFDIANQLTNAYGDQQEAALKMQAAIMQKGGVYDVDMYNTLIHKSQEWSEKYANTAGSYMHMIEVMRNNKISEADIAGGIGESAAKLADLFDQMDPALIGQFAARMKNDMGVSADKMNDMMDMLQRAKNLGIGTTGSEAVNEMNEFFSKVGLGLANLHVQGVEAGRDMAALGTIFMRRGISGQSTGTNFRRILDGIRDPEKWQKSNEEAKKYGVTLDFFDKQKKFVGIENMVNQLGKLKGLDPGAVSSILKPFSGRQGLSTDFLEFLSNEGVSSFNDIRESMNAMASTDEKLSAIMSGMNYQKKVFETSWTNTKAAIGSSLAPLKTKMFELLNTIVVGIRAFVEQHPDITKLSTAILVLVSAALMMAGIIKIIQGIRIAFMLLNLTMEANPFILIATLAILAISLIYANWDKISAWFKNLWGKVKAIFTTFWGWIKPYIMNFTPIGWIIQCWDPISKFFSALWNFIKALFIGAFKIIKYIILNFTPLGLIIKNWLPIKKFFVDLWNDVKKPFMDAFNWLNEFAAKIYNAAKNIITSIIKGIKENLSKVNDMINNVADAISHPFKFLMGDSKVAVSNTVKALPSSAASPFTTSNNNASNFHFMPQITVNGASDPDIGNKLVSSMTPVLDQWYKDKQRNEQRKQF